MAEKAEVFSGSEEGIENGLSEYEKKRLESIKRNEGMLKQLG